MSWSLVSLSDVCDINIGKTPSRANSNYWGKGNPWLSIRDMNQGRELNTTKEEITDLGVKDSNIKCVPKGTVLFSFKLSIGKIGVTQRDMYTNEAIAALPIKDEKLLCEEYLVYALTKIDAGKTTDRAVMGATLNKKKLADLKIPLPPLKEQKRIASILDKADAIRRKRQKAIDLSEQLIRSVFLDMFGDPLMNPKGWDVKSLDSACVDKAGVKAGPFGSALKKEFYTESGYRIYGQEQVIAGTLNIGDYYIDDSRYSKLESCSVMSGDMLISLVGSIGKTLVVPDKFEPGIINPRLVRIRPNKNLLQSEYLQQLFKQPRFQKQLSSYSHGGTMPILNAGILKSLNIQLPPLELQLKFISIIENIEIKMRKFITAQNFDENLFSSLTQQAFNGGLTKQTEAA